MFGTVMFKHPSRDDRNTRTGRADGVTRSALTAMTGFVTCDLRAITSHFVSTKEKKKKRRVQLVSTAGEDTLRIVIGP